MTIKTFYIAYDAINSTNTFTNGDTINGRIILEVSKKTKFKSFIFVAVGSASVQLNGHINNEMFYYATHDIMGDPRQDGLKVIGKGRHVFPFSFKIPDRGIPSSFESSTGNIYHELSAVLTRRMKKKKVKKIDFRFISKANMDIPRLMEPQHGRKNKSVKIFGSGNLSMDVHTKRMGYQQGEALEVVVEISNLSTRSVKPKFILYEKQSFFSQGRSKVLTRYNIKEKTEAVASSGKDTVTKLITIPRDLPPSILNCSIIIVEYWLMVYLDVKCGPSPAIHLPIIILPSSEIPDMEQPPGVRFTKQVQQDSLGSLSESFTLNSAFIYSERVNSAFLVPRPQTFSDVSVSGGGCDSGSC